MTEVPRRHFVEFKLFSIYLEKAANIFSPFQMKAFMLVSKTWLTSSRSVWHIQFKVCNFFQCTKIICQKNLKPKNNCRNSTDFEVYCWVKNPQDFSASVTSLLASLVILYLTLNYMLIILHNNSSSLVPTSSGQTLQTSSFYWIIIMYFLHSIGRFFFIRGNFFIQYISCCLKTRKTKKSTENFHFVTVCGRGEPCLTRKGTKPQSCLTTYYCIAEGGCIMR